MSQSAISKRFFPQSSAKRLLNRAFACYFSVSVAQEQITFFASSMSSPVAKVTKATIESISVQSHLSMQRLPSAGQHFSAAR